MSGGLTLQVFGSTDLEMVTPSETTTLDVATVASVHLETVGGLPGPAGRPGQDGAAIMPAAIRGGFF